MEEAQPLGEVSTSERGARVDDEPIDRPRRGLRTDQWNHRKPYAPVLVPRYLRMTVPGRIDADGSEHAALDLTSVPGAAAVFEAEGVEAVAIAFMNSYANPAHEQAAAAAIDEGHAQASLDALIRVSQTQAGAEADR